VVADFADSMDESAIRCSRCYIPLHAGTQELLNDYLDEAPHAADTEGARFRPVSNNRTGKLDDTITPDGVYKLVRRYALTLRSQDRRSRAARDCRDQCAGSRRRHRQSPGMAGARQYRDHPDLRPA
jgi:hypothetical protein